ncbi:hypothetical protein MRY87_09090 [bacterium]|nr:hypothetical protein [bacterium]
MDNDNILSFRGSSLSNPKQGSLRERERSSLSQREKERAKAKVVRLSKSSPLSSRNVAPENARRKREHRRFGERNVHLLLSQEVMNVDIPNGPFYL